MGWLLPKKPKEHFAKEPWSKSLENSEKVVPVTTEPSKREGEMSRQENFAIIALAIRWNKSQ